MVYLADDVRLGRRVALKVLSPALGVSERLIQRFKREAEAAARIDHPGVCAVHDAGVDRGHSYIAMNYVEGETLAEKIARSAHDGAAARRARSDLMPMVHLVEQAARAVHAAHEEGVIHRDLKPANIMITPDGRPVVLDFGLARDEQSALALTVSGDLFGTPPYMAPEQIQPQLGRPDRRTDVYALGATLYECLTLRRPFEAPTREGLYRASDRTFDSG